MRHLSKLLDAIHALLKSNNTPAARIVGRSVYELGAHAYYVKKHLKQHLQKGSCDSAWKFLMPVTMGSRYMNEQIPEESEFFPAPAHISKPIKCFSEVMPQSAQDDYSYLSEFCHPNVLAFLQYYEWSDPETVRFVDFKTVEGFSGATTAAVLQGLLATEELLNLIGEHDVRTSIVRLLKSVAERETATGAAPS